MKRGLLALAVATILLGNNGMPKSYWGVTNAKAETTANAVVRSGCIRPEVPLGSAPGYVKAWADSYNRALCRTHNRYRIAQFVHCKADGEAFTDCVLLVIDPVRKLVACYAAKIGTNGLLWKPALQTPCKTATPTTGPSKA